MRYVFPRPVYRRAFAFVTAAMIPVSSVTIVFAQATQTAAPAGATTSSSITVFPGGVAPPPPGVPLGGGNNTGASSRPYDPNHPDGFDLGQSGGGAGVLYGNPNGSADLGRGGTLTLGDGLIPEPYIVKRGDTLWAICDTYFRNPYQWPRIWSYNPQIQNPHWIYPGDALHLRGPGGDGAVTSTAAPRTDGSFIDRRRQVAPQTIFLRDTGFIDQDDKDDWGEITGAAVDKMFLTDTDEVYLKIGPGRDPKVGQELTIFRPVRKVNGGNLIQIQGTVRINAWNEKDRVARAAITETLDVVERGARIGPIDRKFNVIPPTRNDQEVKAQVLASVYPHNFYGQNQVVFIDKGEADGIKPGNRMFLLRRGDAWRQSLASDVAGARIALEDESPAAVERVPSGVGDSKLPVEVIGELRVLQVKQHTSACLVTQSTREIELGDDAVARKGY
ncbi:hypothetical protein BH09MYX1_BH09MYX1_55450 [soil metagenome]